MNNVFAILSSGNYTLRKWDAVHIVADGNSNTINSGGGTDAGDPYTVYLRNHLSQHIDISKSVVTNIGVGNQTTVAMLSDFDSQVTPLYVGNQYPHLLIMWEIGNDLFYNGSVANVYDRTVEYCSRGQALGFKVLVMTCPTRIISGLSSAGDTMEQFNVKIELVNASVRNNWREFADGIVDISYDARFRDPRNTTYFRPDGIHFTQTAREVIGEELITNAMKKIKL